MKTGKLTTQGDANRAVAGFLRGLLEKGVVDAVLCSAATPGGGVSAALVSDPEGTDSLLPWAPVMPVQGARLASRLAFDDTGAKVAVVLRPCEARAAVELIKLKQIRPEPLLFITVDCPGTVEFLAFTKAGLSATAEASRLLDAAATGGAKGTDAAPLRTACAVCENPAAAWGHVRIHAFGAKAAEAVGIEADDDVAAQLEAAGVFTFDGAKVEGREGVTQALVKERTAARDALFAAFSQEAGGLDGIKQAFSSCIRCLNCMENCPICYCKLCIFKTPTFDHPSERFVRWSKRKGIQKMPAETMLFHLTRLNHMASSCIGCGLCDTACPMGLPVATLFRKVAGGVQAMLEYTPGRGLEDPIPLSTFREDELQSESGAKD